MARQPGVVHAFDRRVLLEEARDGERVAAMALHAQRQRLDAAQRQEGVERPRHAAHRVLQVGDALAKIAVAAHDGRAADGIRMPVQVLGRRVHRRCRSRARAGAGCREWRRCCRTRSGCRGCGPASPPAARSTSFSSGLVGVSTHIMRVSGAIAASSAADVREIDERHAQSRRSACARSPGCGSCRHRGRAWPRRARRLSSSSSTVAVAAMPEAKAKAGGAALEIRERRLQRVAGRVVGARVLVALVHAGTGLHVGGGRVDRRHHRAGEGVGALPAVDDARRELLPVVSSLMRSPFHSVTACGAASSAGRCA